MKYYLRVLLIEFVVFGLLLNMVGATPQIGTMSHAGVISRPTTTTSVLFTKRINLGGPQVTTGGNTWEADNGCDGSSYTVSDAISGTTDDALYQDEQWGSTLDANNLGVLTCTWSSLPNGLYNVTMKFAEIYFGVAPGVSGGAGIRVFDIYINGTLVKANYDTSATKSSLTADDLVFQNVNVTNGTIQVFMRSSLTTTDRPHIMAIQMDQITQGQTTTGKLLTSYLPGGVCPSSASTDVTSSVQSAVAALANGETLIFNCMVGISSTVSMSGTGKVWDASAGGGVTFLGNPANNYEMFKVENCTDCKVQNLTVDMNSRNALGFTSLTNTRLTFQANTIKNNGAYSGAAVWFRSGNSNKILYNHLRNIQPIWEVQNSIVSDVNCRGFWIGEGGGYERDAEIAHNDTDSSGHTFLVFSGVNGWIHHNYGNNLVYEGVKVSSGGDYPNPGTTIIEDNEFHGTFAGWKQRDQGNGSLFPVCGGHLQLGMAGNGLEQFIIRYNWWDGGSQGMGLIAQIGNVNLYNNKITNQWDTSVLIQSPNHGGTFNIHDNLFQNTRTTASGGPTPVIVRMMSDVGQNYTISKVILANNVIQQSKEMGIHMITRSGSIPDVTISNNAIQGNGWQGLYIEQTAGSISSPTMSGNCWSNNNGGNSNPQLFDSRSILSQPSTSNSCTSPITGTVGPRSAVP